MVSLSLVSVFTFCFTFIQASFPAPLPPTPTFPTSPTSTFPTPPSTPLLPTPPPTPSRCINMYKPGIYDISLDFDKRIFRLKVPKDLGSKTRSPLIFNFHDYGSDNQIQQNISGMDHSLEALQKKWITVYTQGTQLYDTQQQRKVRGFNAGGCCGGFPMHTTPIINDTNYTKAIFDWLNERMCIDEKKVFATGFGNGAFMVHRLACETNLFTGIAPHSGYLAYGGDFSRLCDKKSIGRPVSIIAFHGIDDNVIPFTGNQAKHWQSFTNVMLDWVSRLMCSNDPTPTFDSNTTECVKYENCTGNTFVEFCNVTGLGHTWSGGPGDLGPKTDVIASDYLIKRFETIHDSEQNIETHNS